MRLKWDRIARRNGIRADDETVPARKLARIFGVSQDVIEAEAESHGEDGQDVPLELALDWFYRNQDGELFSGYDAAEEEEP